MTSRRRDDARVRFALQRARVFDALCSSSMSISSIVRDDDDDDDDDDDRDDDRDDDYDDEWDGREVYRGRGRSRGRIDVMGGIVDYSGGVVVPMTCDRKTIVTIAIAMKRANDDYDDIDDDNDDNEDDARKRKEKQMKTTTTRCKVSMRSHRKANDEDDGVDECETTFANAFANGTFASKDMNEWFANAKTSERWGAYVAGSIGEFFRAIVNDDDGGVRDVRRWIARLGTRAKEMRIEVTSDAPRGKGVASSAALEVATVRAMVDLIVKHELVDRDNARFAAHCAMIPFYCHAAENDVVGAPCGFMDQFACFYGKPGYFLALDCDLAKTSAKDFAGEAFRHVELPKSLRIWAIDSGVRHSNSGGSDYAKVRCGTFMGKKMLFNEIDARMDRHLNPRMQSLCGTVNVRAWDKGSMGSPTNWSRHIDEEMSGEEFLARFVRSDDEPYTVVERSSEVMYALRSTVNHALHENDRVKKFLSILDEWQAAGDGDAHSRALALGDLMFASHESYNSVKLGSTETDLIVQIVREIDPERKHLFGAKITGGGCGGAVCVLTSNTPQASEAIERVRERFAQRTGNSEIPILLRAAARRL